MVQARLLDTHCNVQITRLALMHCSKKKPFLQHKATHKARKKGGSELQCGRARQPGNQRRENQPLRLPTAIECLNTGLNGSKVCVNRKMHAMVRLATFPTARLRPLLREGLLQVLLGRRRRRARHLERGWCIHSRPRWRPLVVRRGRIIVNWLERIDIGGRRRARLRRTAAGLFLLRSPDDVDFALGDDPV